jgi:hypothetical protein
MPHVPSRRLAWIVRLVFYPVAIALIAVALHARIADADGDDAVGGGIAFAPQIPPSPFTVAGVASHGDPVTALLGVDGPTELTLPVHFRCTPQLGDVWAVFTETPKILAGRRLRVDHRNIRTTWPSGWRGRTDLRVSGTYARTSLTATLRGRLKLVAGARHATCRAKPVRFVLRKPRAERKGRNAQGELVFARLVGRNVQQLSTVMRVTCPDVNGAAPATWSMAWTRVVPAGSGRLRGAGTATTLRQTVAVKLELGMWGMDKTSDLPERRTAGDGDQAIATNRADVRLGADGVLRGRLSSRVALPATGAGQGVVACTTPPGGVAFALPGR